MSSLSRVDQSRNRAENIAGRDVNIYDSQRRPTTMGRLLERFRKEADGDKTLQEFIDSLQHYLEPIAEEPPANLEHKLQRAGRAAEVPVALKLKELFFKTLLKHQLSPVAQEIYAHILGRLHSNFVAHVRPLLATSRPEVIDSRVITQVIDPALEVLEENDLQLHTQHLQGMLYFLTGNCHIDWRSNA